MNRVVRALRGLRIRWVWLAAAVLAGLLLHIAAVLAITRVMPHRGISALSRIGSVNTMILLPPVGPTHQPLPFLSLDTRYALCRFDLRKGPVVLHASLGDDSWTVALYSSTGDNFYAVSGADLQQRDVELLLTTAQDSLGAALPIAKDATAATITVGVPARTGVAIISAPTISPADADTATRLLTQATCTLHARANAEAK